MNNIFQGSFILALALVGIGFSNEMMKKSNPVEVVEEDVPIKRKKRQPASNSIAVQSEVVRPPDLKVTSSRSSDSAFNQDIDIPTDSGSEVEQASSGPGNNRGYESVYGGGTYNNGSRAGNSNISSGGGNSNPTSVSGSQLSGNSVMTFSNVGNLPTATSPTAPDSSSSDNSPSSAPVDTLTCSANVGGGAFGNPIQVSLSCSTASDIKYCLQEGSCCDPEVAGTIYSVPVVIGAESGNFCLSFYGETASFKVSSVTQQSYAISNTYPDLQISFPKIFYQTTQLAGFNLLSSNDFSKSNYFIGEINLNSHDPGPAGLDMDCQEIVETYVSLPAPTPVEIFTPMDMALIAFGNQLNVPLALSKLTYGENFITSYVVNDNFAAPLYSCSTNKVTLNDFEFFAPEATHGETGTNTGREFSASFVAYSFFEADVDVYRTPAGLATENDNGQELRVGSFGIYY